MNKTFTLRTRFGMLTATLWLLGITMSNTTLSAQSQDKRLIGLYIHQHWPYNRPYAARTWTLDDWHNWADGLKKSGYNTVMIWPMFETIPEPMTASDRAYLNKLGKVITMLHRDFEMKVLFVLCPNIRSNNTEESPRSL